MERVYIKPNIKEIILKNSDAPEHADIYAYEADTEEHARKLGSLFVIGQVQQQSDDVAYMVNLVAALAKREYYARVTLTPKEAFTNTLKKINEVAQEFFKNKDLAMNIGIFAIAGDQILLSRLGKFKILLAREGKTIDVLNNLQLFEKEHIQEKEFSNIVSGKITPTDRILAFYPGQALASRERYLKSYFLKLSQAEFTEKVEQMKTKNDQFSCALLYLNLETVRKAATAPKIEPSELAPATLAEQPEQPIVKPSPYAAPFYEKSGSAPKEGAQPKSAPEPTAGTQTLPPAQKPVDEPPHIIPTEFSLGKRDTMLSRFMKKFHMSFRFRGRQKFGLIIIVAAVIVGSAFAVRSMFMTDPQAKQLDAAISQAQGQLQVAQNNIDQKNDAEARRLLLGSLANIQNLPANSAKKTADLKGQILSLLDTVDNVVPSSPALIYQLPADLGQARLLSLTDSDLYIYAAGSNASQSLVTVENNALKNTLSVHDIQPTLMLNNNDIPALLDPANQNIGVPGENSLSVYQFSFSQAPADVALYQDNLYAIAGDTIDKISDAVKGKTTVQQWLKEGVTLPADSTHIVVDGDIFILTASGRLLTYFKGAVSNDVQTQLTTTSADFLFTGQDSPFLYLANFSLKRIYVLDKKTGELVKTYHIDSDQPVLSAALGPNEIIYFITSDSKVWSLK